MAEFEKHGVHLPRRRDPVGMIVKPLGGSFVPVLEKARHDPHVPRIIDGDGSRRAVSEHVGR